MNVEVAAESRYGLTTRALARAHGMSESAIDRRIASGRWVPVLPGVYRVRGAPVTARQRALAASLWGGDDALVSHVVAGRLLRLDGVPSPTRMEISVPRSTSLGAADVIVHRTSLNPLDRVAVDDIPCTSATRTILDLAGVLGDEALEVAFESARRMRLTAVSALARRAEELCGRGRAGSARVRRLISIAGDRPLESRLEVKAARLLRRSGVHPAALQFPVGSYRLDFAWPSLLLAVECDGFDWHGNRLAWKRDRRRIAALEAAGWRIVHLTWDDVTKRPDQTIARITLGLADRAA